VGYIVPGCWWAAGCWFGDYDAYVRFVVCGNAVEDQGAWLRGGVDWCRAFRREFLVGGVAACVAGPDDVFTLGRCKVVFVGQRATHVP